MAPVVALFFLWGMGGGGRVFLGGGGGNGRVEVLALFGL